MDGSQDLPREVSVEDGKVKIEGPNGMTMTPDAALIMGARLATAADEAREAWLNDRGEEWNQAPRPDAGRCENIDRASPTLRG